MATKGTQMRSSMIAETIPIIASGVQLLPLLERGAAEGAAGTDVSVDAVDAIVIEGTQSDFRSCIKCLICRVGTMRC